jgi:hypothetical protein
MARLAPVRGGYHLAMEWFMQLRPTPEALKNGRRTMVAVGVIVVGVALFMVLTPGAIDANWLAILAATIVTLIGDGIAYLGQPTLTRYRVGLITTGIGIAAAFFFLIAEPLKTVAI